MLGKTFQQLGREDLARRTSTAPSSCAEICAALASYSWNESANLLLVVDFGYGPKKVTDFDGSIVGFGPKPNEEGRIPPPRVSMDGRPVDVSAFDEPPVDLLALAQDRRWQSIDTIRAVKSAVGTGLIAGGDLQRESLTKYEEAAVLVAAGLLLKATSQADVRQWEMLPRTTFVLPLRVAPGRARRHGRFPRPLRHEADVAAAARARTGEATYYFRMQRGTPAPTTGLRRRWRARSLETKPHLKDGRLSTHLQLAASQHPLLINAAKPQTARLALARHVAHEDVSCCSRP